MPLTAFFRRDGTIQRIYNDELDETLLRRLIDELLRA